MTSVGDVFKFQSFVEQFSELYSHPEEFVTFKRIDCNRLQYNFNSWCDILWKIYRLNKD